MMLARASEVTGTDLSGPKECFLQRWRYAQPVAVQTANPAHVFKEPAQLIVAGESFAGGKIEGARISRGSAAVRTALALY